MKKLLQWIYPPRCPICDKIWQPKIEQNRMMYCCPDCRKKLPWVRGAVCMKCGKPVGKEQEYCEDCQKQKHLFGQGAAAFTYSEGLPDAVFRMKFQNRRDYLDFFADVMVLALRRHLPQWQPQVILPVPMHWKKRARRGYNQSELLAEKLSERLGIPTEKKWARCIRRTAEQKRLSRSERRKNLSGSFRLSGKLQGVTRVLLVDDVYTTGSTMDELARILRMDGIYEVYFIVICTGKGKKGGMHEEKSVLY